MTVKGKKGAAMVPFSKLPRMERLRVQGKADLTEEADDNDSGESEGENGATMSKAEKEKKKMRGRGRTLKRYETKLSSLSSLAPPHSTCVTDIYGSKGRMSLTLLPLHYAPNWRNRKKRPSVVNCKRRELNKPNHPRWTVSNDHAVPV